MSVEKKGKGKTGSPRLAGTFPPLPNAEFHCLCACVYAECVHECVWLLGDRETCMEIVWEKQGAVSWSTNQHQNFSTSPSNQFLGPPTDRHTLPSTQSDQGKKKKKRGASLWNLNTRDVNKNMCIQCSCAGRLRNPAFISFCVIYVSDDHL